MPKKTDYPPLDPREFISACRDLFGDSYLNRLWNLAKTGSRTLNRWTAKTPYVVEESIRENWIEKHEKILKRLMKEPGGPEIARALVGRHANMVGCELKVCADVVPDQDTIEGELLDDYPPTVAYHDAIRRDAPIGETRYLCSEAKRELDETQALVEEKWASKQE